MCVAVFPFQQLVGVATVDDCVMLTRQYDLVMCALHDDYNAIEVLEIVD